MFLQEKNRILYQIEQKRVDKKIKKPYHFLGLQWLFLSCRNVRLVRTFDILLIIYGVREKATATKKLPLCLTKIIRKYIICKRLVKCSLKKLKKRKKEKFENCFLSNAIFIIWFFFSFRSDWKFSTAFLKTQFLWSNFFSVSGLTENL